MVVAVKIGKGCQIAIRLPTWIAMTVPPQPTCSFSKRKDHIFPIWENTYAGPSLSFKVLPRPCGVVEPDSADRLSFGMANRWLVPIELAAVRTWWRVPSPVRPTVHHRGVPNHDLVGRVLEEIPPWIYASNVYGTALLLSLPRMVTRLR